MNVTYKNTVVFCIGVCKNFEIYFLTLLKGGKTRIQRKKYK